MDLNLRGRTALVFGAGGGLGSAIALSLASEGVRVAIADISSDALDRTASSITATGGEVISLRWDLADLAGIDSHFKTIEDQFGGLDILVNNTGGPPPTAVSLQPAEAWEKHFRAMILSVIGITDRALPGMRERGWGRIITSTSSGVVAPIANLGLSNALRSTLLGWSKTLSREVGPHGITSNIVVPGRIATARIGFLDQQKAQREGRSVEEVAAESTGAIALGRYGKPSEYADMVTFLASDRATYLTGSVFRVDGGLIPSI